MAPMPGYLGTRVDESGQRFGVFVVSDRDYSIVDERGRAITTVERRSHVGPLLLIPKSNPKWGF